MVWLVVSKPLFYVWKQAGNRNLEYINVVFGRCSWRRIKAKHDVRACPRTESRAAYAWGYRRNRRLVGVHIWGRAGHGTCIFKPASFCENGSREKKRRHHWRAVLALNRLYHDKMKRFHHWRASLALNRLYHPDRATNKTGEEHHPVRPLRVRWCPRRDGQQRPRTGGELGDGREGGGEDAPGRADGG